MSTKPDSKKVISSKDNSSDENDEQKVNIDVSNIFETIKLKENIYLNSSDINHNISNIILNKLRKKVEGKCIKNGYVTTLHPWLNYQNLMDGPSSSWSMQWAKTLG